MNVARLKAFIVYRHKATMELSLRLLALHLGLFFVSCTNVTENISAEVDLMLSYFYYYSYFLFLHRQAAVTLSCPEVETPFNALMNQQNYQVKYKDHFLSR